MRRLSPRLLVAVPLLVGATIAVAGCESLTLDSQTAQQQDLIGPMQITTPMETCDFGPPGVNDTCDPLQSRQLLVGYRLPAGTTAPESVASSGSNDTAPTTFHKSTSYASELQRLAPAPAGEEWVGYISDQLNLPALSGNGPDKETLAPAFGIPSSLVGSPFTYRTVIGDRDNTTVTDATRDVVCNATSLTGTSADSSTFCDTDPTDTTTLNSDVTTPATNDLQLVAGSAPTVHAGDTATVPFDARLLGPALSGGGFNLAALSPLPGGAAAPSAPVIAPTPGDNAESATLKVPASTPAGDYPVTLTATHGSQSRSATGTVHVLAVPGLVITFKPHSLNVSNSGLVTLPITCPSASIDPCDGTVTLGTAGKVLIAKKHKARKRALKLGSGKFTLVPGASGTVKIKVSSPGRKALARTGRLGAKATFVMTNRAGQKSTTVKHLTLRGPKARKKHKGK
jgi:hypothetical protein